MPQILVVDDDRIFRQMLRDALEYMDVVVLTASDGVEALDMLEQIHPDMMIFDVQMPSMSGYDLARKVRTNPAYSRIKLIAMTGNRMAGSAPEMKLVDVLVFKPLNLIELARHIERLLHSPV